MTRPIFFDLEYEIITPLYMAGAEQRRAELRAPSIRGAVRAWYRALDPLFEENEPRCFGAAFDKEEGKSGQTRQSPFLLQVLRAPGEGRFRLNRRDYEHFNEGRPPTRTNGVLYTGYTLMDRFNERQAFQASDSRTRQTFTLRLLFPRSDHPEELYHRVLGSFWALGHLGALGSRANRGWGSVQLTGVKAGPGKTVPRELKIIERHYQPAATTSARQWGSKVAGVLKVFNDTIGAPERRGHALATPHLGAAAKVFVEEHPVGEWAVAVNMIGAALQEYRRAEGRPDRDMIVRLLLKRAGHPDGEEPRTAPQRTAFGLPYTMRYEITPAWVVKLGISKLLPDTVEYNPGDRSRSDSPPRHSSPLHLRVVKLDDGYHPVTVRLAGDPVGSLPRSADNQAPQVSIGARITGGGRRPMESPFVDPLPRPEPTDGLLDGFMDKILRYSLSIPVPK